MALDLLNRADAGAASVTSRSDGAPTSRRAAQPAESLCSTSAAGWCNLAAECGIASARRSQLSPNRLYTPGRPKAVDESPAIRSDRNFTQTSDHYIIEF